MYVCVCGCVCVCVCVVGLISSVESKRLGYQRPLAVGEDDLLLRNAVLKTELSNPGCRMGGRAADNIDASMSTWMVPERSSIFCQPNILGVGALQADPLAHTGLS